MAACSPTLRPSGRPLQPELAPDMLRAWSGFRTADDRGVVFDRVNSSANVYTIAMIQREHGSRGAGLNAPGAPIHDRSVGSPERQRRHDDPLEKPLVSCALGDGYLLELTECDFVGFHMSLGRASAMRKIPIPDLEPDLRELSDDYSRRLSSNGLELIRDPLVVCLRVDPDAEAQDHLVGM